MADKNPDNLNGAIRMKDILSYTDLRKTESSAPRHLSLRGRGTSIVIIVFIITVTMAIVFSDFLPEGESIAMSDSTTQVVISIVTILGIICLFVMFYLRNNHIHFLRSSLKDNSDFGVLGQTLRVTVQTIIMHIFAVGTISYIVFMLIKVFTLLQKCHEGRITLLMYSLLAVFCVLQLVFFWKFNEKECNSSLSRLLMSFVFGANINVYLCVLIQETLSTLNEQTSSHNHSVHCNNTSIENREDNTYQYLYPFVIEYSLMSVQLLYLVWAISHETKKEQADITDSFMIMSEEHEEQPLLDVGNRRNGCMRLKCMHAFYIGLLIYIPLCVTTFVNRGDTWNLIRNIIELVSLVLLLLSCIVGLTLNRVTSRINYNQNVRRENWVLFISAGSVSAFHSFRLIAILKFVAKNGFNSSTYDSLDTRMLVAIFHILSVHFQTLYLRNCRIIKTNRMSLRQRCNLQICTYVLVANAFNWIVDSFIPYHKYDNSHLADVAPDVYGFRNWILISNILVPIIIYYRLHCVFICLNLINS